MNKLKLTHLFATALSACVLSAPFTTMAQDQHDAFRYSDLSTQGTARSIGFGGALGSIGGDFSSLSVNPAGIGVYRNSEFMFTPAIRINNASGSLNGNTTSDNNTRFTVPNIGIVFTSAQRGRRYERSKWKSASFGFGINRIADFNSNSVYSGTINSSGSFTQLMALDANTYAFPGDVDDMNTLGGKGYEAFLLDTLNNRYVSVLDGPSYNGTTRNVKQQRVVRERGSMSDIVISFGGNYMEKLLIGATIGIPTVSYRRDMTMEESDLTADRTDFFDNFSYRESLKTTGTGINLKLGAIYKPDDHFRFGLAFHTPTYFNLKDESSWSILSNTDDFKNDLGRTDGPNTERYSTDYFDLITYEYNLITPWRTNLSASAIIGKLGFLTVDYEYVDYSSARFRYEINRSNSETYANDLIRSTYKGGHIFRLGGEARLDLLMLRAGVGYQTSPFKAGGGERLNLSAGAGLRFDNWFLDLGVAHSRLESSVQPYDLSAISIVAPTAKMDYAFNNIAMTIGFKF